jgi:hypothetical protein
MASQCTDPVQDMTVALTGFAPTSVRVTRLRAVLPASQLDQDLMLQASTGGTRDRVYRYGNVLHTPPPPVCDSNPDAGQNTDSGHLADGAAAPPNGYVAGGGCTTRCSVGRSAPSRSVPWGWLAAASSWIVIRRRRRGR